MNVFITGITGTIGTAIAKLHSERGDIVYGCARSERGVVHWLDENRGLRATISLGCASQLAIPNSDMGMLLRGPIRGGWLYHCAAMKHVDICEMQPQQCYMQNVVLTNLISQVCYQNDVWMTFVSSDKACLPESIYGATKLLGEKLVISQEGAVVRLGNVIGSSGSVIERWIRDIKEGRNICITDPAMTRYFMTSRQAAEFICDQAIHGFVSIPTYIRSAQIGELAEYVLKMCNKSTSGSFNSTIKEIGKRPGETTHQWLAPPGSNLLFDRARTLLVSHAGTVSPNGLCSSSALRWDLESLVAASGIKI